MARPEDLTIDFKKLLRMTVRDRVQMAQSREGPSYLAALTPTQYAMLFPDYYRKQLPDMGLTAATSGATPLGIVSGEGPSDGKMPTAVPTAPSREPPTTGGKEAGAGAPAPGPAKSPVAKESWQQRLMREAQERKTGRTAPSVGEYKGGVSTDTSGKIDAVSFYKTSVAKIRGSRLDGFVPKDGAKFGIVKGTPEEWARLFTMIGQQESKLQKAEVNPDGTLKKFRSTPSGEKSYGPLQFNKGEYGLKTWEDVNDPEKNIEALIRVTEMWSLKSGVISGQGKGSGYSSGWGGMSAYFGSLRRPNETLQHGDWFEKSVGSVVKEEATKVLPPTTDDTGKVVPGQTPGRMAPTTPQPLTALPEGLDPGIVEHYKTLKEDEQKKFLESITGVQPETINQYYREDPNRSASPQVVREKTDLALKEGYIPAVTGKMWHEGHGLTSQYGYGRNRLHAGVDIYATDPETGKLLVGDQAPVHAPEEGTITGVMINRGRAGNFVTFRDKNGFEHRFLHTAQTPAINPDTGKPWKTGDKIRKGQVVTTVTGSGTQFGATASRMGVEEAVEYYDKRKGGWGSVNKPHLHHEVRKNGKLVNPKTGQPYINELYPEYGQAGINQRGYHPSKDVIGIAIPTPPLSERAITFGRPPEEAVAVTTPQTAPPSTEPPAAGTTGSPTPSPPDYKGAIQPRTGATAEPTKTTTNVTTSSRKEVGGVVVEQDGKPVPGAEDNPEVKLARQIKKDLEGGSKATAEPVAPKQNDLLPDASDPKVQKAMENAKPTGEDYRETVKKMQYGGSVHSAADESILVSNAHTGKPLFTMNEEETLHKDEKDRLIVRPNRRGDSEEIERLAKSREDYMNNDARDRMIATSTQANQQATAPSSPVNNPNLQQMYSQMAQESMSTYKTPSAARAFKESRFQGRGDDPFALAPANIKT